MRSYLELNFDHIRKEIAPGIKYAYAFHSYVGTIELQQSSVTQCAVAVNASHDGRAFGLHGYVGFKEGKLKWDECPTFTRNPFQGYDSAFQIGGVLDTVLEQLQAHRDEIERLFWVAAFADHSYKKAIAAERVTLLAAALQEAKDEQRLYAE